MSPLRLAAVAIVCLFGVGVQNSAEPVVTRVLQNAGYRVAAAGFDTTYDRFVQDVITLTEVEAPPFKEAARGEVFARLMRETGPVSVDKDPEGNILVMRRGTDPSAPLVVIAAHLDSVFPEGTDVRVRRRGTELSAPGVSDNAQGLAMLVALSRAFQTSRIATHSDVLFVGNVGEEGTGDLRGMKYLFTSGRYKERIRSFVAIDGVGDGDLIVTRGVGSKRYRVTFNGPGGHSFGAFGLVSPATAMAAAIQALSSLSVPASPKTTFNVGAIGGGTSVNSIPSSTWMDVDLRSESPAELVRLDEAFRAIVDDAVAGENRARSIEAGRITADVKVLGSRPSGHTPASARLVTIAAAATRALGGSPTFGASSTDANLPMSLGIPAITIDSGLPGGRPHSPDEWVNVDRRYVVRGLSRLLLLTMSLAGV